MSLLMSGNVRVVVFCICSFFATGKAVTACSVFLYGKVEGGLFVARNYDWDSGEGLVVINKRNVEKVALTFDKPAHWTSKFGSVTFCQYGREFPCDGMNEAGLMVTVLWLDESEYPSPDRRPTVSTLQWVQYQLDTAKTVTQVVSSDTSLRITSISGSSVHYFVADRTGDCATIELIDGRMVVHRGKQLPFRALTNSPYAKSMKVAKSISMVGGSKSAGQSESSIDRFCRAAEAANPKRRFVAFDSDYGFETLRNLRQSDFTKWQIVYDLSGGRIKFRTSDFPNTKQIRLADFNLTTATPVSVFDMNSPGEGDIREQFSVYSEAQNREIFMTAMKESGVLEDHPNREQLIEMVVRYPENCGKSVSESIP